MEPKKEEPADTDLVIARYVEEISELYQFIGLLAACGLTLNGVPVIEALRALRRIGCSKFTDPYQKAPLADTNHQETQ